MRDQGVYFDNSHSIFPTLTMVNSAAMGTGHFPGDMGSFANTVYTGFPVASANGSVTPMIENDAILGEVNAGFGGNYLNEETLLAAARKAGFLTASVGKVGPVAVYDVTERSGEQTIVIDDLTGHPAGLPLSNKTRDALQAAGLPNLAPARGDNAKAGNAKTPGTTVANVEQQRYFADVTTKSILPMFKAVGKPFVLVFWSRDPDGTQHNQGDSLGRLMPGINGPTSQAAIKNADDNLAAILDALKALGLEATTDVFVSSDHGFSTISKDSQTSAASKITYKDVPAGQLPSGFVAIDIAKTLDLPLFDSDAKGARVDFNAGQHPSKANGLIGKDPMSPDVVVAANGSTDLIYLPKPNAKEARRKDRRYAAGTGLHQRIIRGRFLRQHPWNPAAERYQSKGLGGNPSASDRHQFSLFCGELWRFSDVRRQCRRSHAATGTRDARQFQPRRHQKLYGCHRSRFPLTLR